MNAVNTSVSRGQNHFQNPIAMKSCFTFPLFFQCLVLLCILTGSVHSLQAQATLTVQGVLTKSDGSAVPDAPYSLTFRLWKGASTTNPSDMVHQETIGDVETNGGVYSVVLGTNGTAITAPFNQLYYLGVSVGSSSNELLPRPLLTHAPYALSLIGQNNKFPSTGLVTADAINVAGDLSIGGSFNVSTVTATGAINGASLTVTGAISAASMNASGTISGTAFVASRGAPAVGVAGKGYSFGNLGDQDGGLFSLDDNNVGLYANGVLSLEGTNSGIRVPGSTLTQGQFLTRSLANGGGYTFNYDNDSGLFGVQDGEVEIRCNNAGRMLFGANGSTYSNQSGGFFIQSGRLYINNVPDFNGKNMQWDENSGLVGADNSSRRYKYDIKPLEADFSAILKAEAKIYRRKSDTTRIEIGYIAEEMDSLGLKPLVFYDKEGRVEAFDYERMILYVTEVLKIQHKDIEVLQAEIALLKSENAALRTENMSLKTSKGDLLKQQQEFTAQLNEISKRIQALESVGTGK